MLYPIITESRTLTDLNGVWNFYLDDEKKEIDVSKPLVTDAVMAVPGSFNDQGVLSKIRNQLGLFGMKESLQLPNPYYQKESFCVLDLLLIKQRFT